MKIKILLAVTITTTLLAGCVIRPAHHGHNVRVKVPVKTVVVLNNEHQSNKVLVVNVKPKKKRKCWVHNKHWHCHR